ncbi:hypothetical protein [Kitasatospora sp. DSM 101779]|uniref:hypothetical protein n=1 Tax=Kitasatospora sp. DSM 101779 TaxID=2853165 RepID=UPI0021D85445|nr:hypothetical protein [Kitasatospora sp. DSM 101779]MCU7821009.1 hypothetical protein [Kitasatospora sp. DSM 101779]
MTEHATPETSAPGAGGCCAPATSPAPPSATGSAQSAPCCGTAKDAAGAGACCAPAAKQEAAASGAGCC